MAAPFNEKEETGVKLIEVESSLLSIYNDLNGKQEESAVFRPLAIWMQKL